MFDCRSDDSAGLQAIEDHSSLNFNAVVKHYIFKLNLVKFRIDDKNDASFIYFDNKKHNNWE